MMAGIKRKARKRGMKKYGILLILTLLLFLVASFQYLLTVTPNSIDYFKTTVDNIGELTETTDYLTGETVTIEMVSTLDKIYLVFLVILYITSVVGIAFTVFFLCKSILIFLDNEHTKQAYFASLFGYICLVCALLLPDGATEIYYLSKMAVFDVELYKILFFVVALIPMIFIPSRISRVLTEEEVDNIKKNSEEEINNGDIYEKF